VRREGKGKETMFCWIWALHGVGMVMTGYAFVVYETTDKNSMACLCSSGILVIARIAFCRVGAWSLAANGSLLHSKRYCGFSDDLPKMERP
jgi:hypothetical protein